MEARSLFTRRIHSSFRVARLAAVLLLLFPAGGCALRDGDRWNPDRYRDERAVDIDHRLQRPEPVVQNPF
jgi:hypothetical protein